MFELFSVIILFVEIDIFVLKRINIKQMINYVKFYHPQYYWNQDYQHGIKHKKENI